MFNLLNSIIPKIDQNFDFDIFFDYFPSLNRLSSTPQDAFYHAEGDVWTHTKMVCLELIQLRDYMQASDEDKFIMFYSCLLHDIAKPDCTKFEDSRITSAGHSKRGAIDTRIDLWKKEIPFHIREKIVNIISCHQVPFFAFNQKSKENLPTRTPEFLAHQLSWQLPLNLLINVAKADMLGRHYINKKQSMDDIELFQQLCIEEDCYFNPKVFFNDNTRMKYFSSNGAISPNYEFYKEEGSSVTVLCGLPASGKNFWIEQNSFNIPIISFDDTKLEYGLREGDNVGKAVHDTIDKAKALLRKKENFIWNSTNINPQMRKKTLDLLFSYNATVNIVYLECDYNELKNRNNQRNSSISNKKIDDMLFKWDVPTPIETHQISYEISKNSLKSKFSR